MSSGCRRCGASLTHRRRNARFCSDNCYRALSRGTMLFTEQSCRGCGVRFVPKSKTQKFCNHACGQDWWAKNPSESTLAFRRAWKPTTASKRKYVERHRATKYGLTIEKLRAILELGCYAPNCNIVGTGKNGLHIDHDHSCCPGRKSCGLCVRGALCSFHNVYLGYLERDWSFAVWAMRQPSLVLKVRREA